MGGRYGGHLIVYIMWSMFLPAVNLFCMLVQEVTCFEVILGHLSSETTHQMYIKLLLGD